MLLLATVALAADLVTGTVVDGSGQPVAGVHIDAARLTDRGVSHRTDVETAADGRFAVPPSADPARMVRVQARTEDGWSSAPRFVTVLPGEVTLALRPPAQLDLVLIGVQPPAQITAIAVADELMDLGSVQIHDGSWTGAPLVGHAGHWRVTVSQGERAAYLDLVLSPGEKRTVRVLMPPAGEIGVTLPDAMRGDRAICLLTPGEAGNRYGMPTVMDCHDLEPPSMDLGRIAGGVQILEVRQGDRSVRYTLDVEGDTWCHFRLPPPEETVIGGIIGASFALESQPARIDGVVPGTPAEDAGLRPGDVILSVDGEPVTSGMEALIAVRLGGERVRLTVGREGRRREVRVKRLPPAPEPPRITPERCGERPRPPEPEQREPYGLPYKTYPRPLPSDRKTPADPGATPER